MSIWAFGIILIAVLNFAVRIGNIFILLVSSSSSFILLLKRDMIFHKYSDIFNSFLTHLSDIHVVIAQAEELEVLRGKSPQMLWLEDLDQFVDELEVCNLC